MGGLTKQGKLGSALGEKKWMAVNYNDQNRRQEVHLELNRWVL